MPATTQKQTGTFEALVLGMASLFDPLKEDLANGRARVVLAELGLQLPPSVDGVSAFSTAVQNLITSANKIPGLVTQLKNAIETEDTNNIFRVGRELASLIKNIIKGFSDLSNAVRGLSASTGIPANTLNDFANQLPTRLFDYLLVKNLSGIPVVPEVLEFIGVIKQEVRNAGSGNPNLPEFTDYSIHIDKMIKFIKSPANHFKTLYKWGDPTFDGDLLLPVLQHLLTNAGFPAVIDSSGPNAVLDILFAEIAAKTDINPKGLEIKLVEKINIENAIPFNQGGDWQLEAFSTGNMEASTSLVIQPNGNFIFKPPTAIADGALGVQFTAGKENSSPFIIFGEAGSSRLEVSQFLLGAKTNLKFDSATNSAQSKFTISGDIKGGKLLIDVSSADGFIGKILSGIRMENDFDLGIGFSSEQGLFFHGSSTLEIKLALHISLGPIEINGLTLIIGLKEDKIPVEFALDIKAELGPLQIVVEQFGAKADLTFPSDQKGNLGFMNLNPGFKPPKGIGLSINAGAVIGGGYLFFDFEKEEYAGALELTIAGFISAKAIGLITTKMPDGSKGFSMLIIITAEFFPPFQLGFGFTLIGVGGLLGLHRTVLLNPLRDGVRTGAVNSIMFPTNVIANAPRIISDLKTIFPVYEGKFLIGPMAKMGWGTPTLISLSFGLIIEIPGNIAILGVLKLILPDEKVPIVKIQVAFVGTIDFDKKMLTFDASLYESNILQVMTLEGDMAVRLAWGDQPNFVMSVGGFHPSFTPPPLALPTLRRLAINILNTSISRIRVECYQAVTSNTVQFGARAEIFFDLKACSIDGHIGFDALFQFNPFYFIIALSAGFKLKAIGISLMTVRVKMSLEGPTPWHAKGTGKVSLLFFDISANFNKSWGETKTTTLPQITILPLFLEQLQKKEQWNTVLTSSKNLLVTLRKLDEATESLLVLHPAGSLVLQQKLVPLKVNIDKIGNQKTADVKQLKIDSVSSNGTALSIKEVKESFARAQYQNLTDAEKLSKPSFEKMQGGVEITMGNNTIKNGKMVRKKIEYELTIIDKEPVKPFVFGKFFLELNIMFHHFIKGGSVYKSKLSKSTLEKLQPFEQKLNVQEELYTVAFQNNNKAFNAGSTFSSEMEAQSFMQDKISSNPSLKKQIHIVPQFELQES